MKHCDDLILEISVPFSSPAVSVLLAALAGWLRVQEGIRSRAEVGGSRTVGRALFDIIQNAMALNLYYMLLEC